MRLIILLCAAVLIITRAAYGQSVVYDWNDYQFVVDHHDVSDHRTINHVVETKLFHILTILDLIRAINTNLYERLRFIKGIVPHILAVAYKTHEIYTLGQKESVEDILSAAQVLQYVKEVFEEISAEIKDDVIICIHVLLSFVRFRLQDLYLLSIR